MKKKAEGDMNLGYMGEWQSMYCKDIEQLTDRLKCNYDKYKYDDPLAKNEPKRKAMERKRKGRHKFAVQRICTEEDPFLCATKDRDDIEKEPEPMCKDIDACPEPGSTMEDIYKDAKDFYKILLDAMSF